MQLKIGLGKSIITPPLPFYLAGHRLPRLTNSIADPLQARAMTFSYGDRRLCLIAVDLLWIGREQITELRRKIHASTKIPESYIFVACSHTHSGPDVLEWYGPEYNLPNTHVESLLDQISSAAYISSKTLVSCVADMVVSQVPSGVNRRLMVHSGVERHPNISGATDDNLSVIRFKDMQGKLLAVLFHHGTHPVVLGVDSYCVSGDWPGMTANYAEAQLGVFAAFLGGAFGDVNPVIWTNETYLNATRFSEWIGSAVISLVHSYQKENVAAISYLDTATAEITWPSVAHPYLTTYQRKRAEGADRTITTEIMAVRIGGINLIGVPGECLSEASLSLFGVQTSPYLVVSCVNDYLGYLPLRANYERGGYETRAVMLAKGAAEEIGKIGALLLNRLNEKFTKES